MPNELIAVNFAFDDLRDAPMIQSAVQEALDSDFGDFERQSFHWVD